MIDLKGIPFYLSEDDIKWVQNTLAGMTVEKKLAHLFCLITYTSDEGFLTGLAKDFGCGGVMTRTMDVDEICETVRILQEAAPIPMLISANLEAGLNQACTTGTKLGCEMAIAATDSVKYARLLGKTIGEEASALGLNWSFSPIIDIDMNYRNPITNTRTFGADPERVAKMGKAYVETVQRYDMATSIKHFPGDGVDERDQHLVASVNSLSCAEWDMTFGMAYKTCIDAGAKTVMVGHILQPAYSRMLNPALKDNQILPASLSKELVTDLLKNKLGFRGLTITDSTSMAGMTSILPRSKAVPLSIAAGCDMFLFTKNFDEDWGFMQQGYRDGVITPERLNDAVTKILALKASMKLHVKKADGSIFPDPAKASAIVGCAEHKAWAREVADHSITLVKSEAGVLPLSSKRFPRVLLYGKEAGSSAISFGAATGAIDSFQAMLAGEGYQVTRFVPTNGWEGFSESIQSFVDKYDLIIYVANLATKSNQTVVRIEWAEPMGADVPVFCHTIPTIFISLENPYHLVDVPQVKTFINTYGSTPEILSSLLDKLHGRSEFTGKSPVDAFCGLWDTRL